MCNITEFTDGFRDHDRKSTYFFCTVYKEYYSPANKTNYSVINYSEGNFGGMTNKVILCGLAFGNNEMDTAYLQVKKLFQNSIIKCL